MIEEFDVGLADEANPSGCGVPAHETGCLCDVDLDRSPARPGRLMLPQGVHTVREWLGWCEDVAEGQERLLEAVRGLSADQVLEHAEQTRDALGRFRDGQKNLDMFTAQRVEVRAHIIAMLTSGLTLKSIGRVLGMEATEVARWYGSHGFAESDLERWVACDEAMRKRDSWTYVALSEEFGLHRRRIEAYALTVGMRSKAYTPDDVRNRAMELTDDGLSAAEIVRAVNAELGSDINAANVYSWRARRRAA